MSLGRNLIKNITSLEPVAGTLQQLWISYNQIEKLGGLTCLKNLKVLYMSNNKVRREGKEKGNRGRATAALDLV